MPLLGELAVGTLDGCRIRISSNAQNFVKVAPRLVTSGHEQASALVLSVVIVVIIVDKRRRSLGVSRHHASTAR
jgi:hypothetical protein